MADKIDANKTAASSAPAKAAGGAKAAAPLKPAPASRPAVTAKAAPAPKVAAKPAPKPPVAKSEPAKPDLFGSGPAKSVPTPAPSAKPTQAAPIPDVAKAVPEAGKPAPKPETAEAPKIKSAPDAKAETPEPIEMAAPKRGRPPKAMSAIEPAPIVAPKAEAVAAAAITEGSKIMNETVAKAQDSAKKATQDAAAFTQEAAGRTQALFGEFSQRAKSSYEKSVHLAEEMTEFSKGNVEALVESSRVAAKGVESLGQEAADYARRALENGAAAFRTFASAKSPTEFFRLQSDYAKSYFDDAVAEGSKVTEAWLKLAGDVAQPLSNRYSVAVEKIKQATA